MSGTRTTALARRVSFQTFWDQELQCWYYTPRRFLILMNKTDFYFFSVSDLSSTSSICRQSSNRTVWNKKAKVWFLFIYFFLTPQTHPKAVFTLGFLIRVWTHKSSLFRSYYSHIPVWCSIRSSLSLRLKTCVLFIVEEWRFISRSWRAWIMHVDLCTCGSLQRRGLFTLTNPNMSR